MSFGVGPPSPSAQPISRAIAGGVARSRPSAATAASNCVWSSTDHVKRGVGGPTNGRACAPPLSLLPTAHFVAGGLG